MRSNVIAFFLEKRFNLFPLFVQQVARYEVKQALKASAVVACILMHEIRIVLNPMTIKTGLKVTALFK